MNMASIKTLSAKIMTVGLLSGAFLISSSSKAQAQVSFGIQLGGPVYGQTVYRAPAPVYGYDQGGYGYNGYGYNGYGDREAFERHEAHERREAQERLYAQLRREEHERHEAWERERRSDHDGWDRHDDRDHFRGDGYERR